MALTGEEAEAAIEFAEFIQIEGEEEDPVLEGVPPR